MWAVIPCAFKDMPFPWALWYGKCPRSFLKYFYLMHRTCRMFGKQMCIFIRYSTYLFAAIKVTKRLVRVRWGNERLEISISHSLFHVDWRLDWRLETLEICISHSLFHVDQRHGLHVLPRFTMYNGFSTSRIRYNSILYKFKRNGM